MSLANLIKLLINYFFLHSPPIKQPIKVDNSVISTPNSEIQDLILTHYDCSPQHIKNMQYYKLNKIGECKIKPADFQFLPAQASIFSQIRTLQVRADAIYAKISDKENFGRKISLNRGFRFNQDNWNVNSLERPFFPTDIEARWQLARHVLLSKWYSLTYLATHACRLIYKPNKAVFNSIAIAILHSDTEIWYRIYGTTNSLQNREIILGLTVPKKPRTR